MSACGSGKLAPVSTIDAGSSGPGSLHTVRKGETVYAIAWRYGFDYRNIASWNQLKEPYLIYPGQTLTLTGPVPVNNTASVAVGEAPSSAAGDAPSSKASAKPSSGPVKRRPASPRAPKPKAAPAPRARRKPANAPPKVASKQPATARQASRNPSQARVSRSDEALDNAKISTWIWPTKGKPKGRFGKRGGKGIDIEGRRGQDVSAAHSGQVVYSGGGLIGYGKLIIVKHNKRFLSAYAHNSALYVKEGDFVDRGQRIAEMGSSGTDRVKLHFEIRRDGKPVNPLQYLPR